MSRDTAHQERNPLRHPCYMTSGRVGFISYLDMSDLIVIGSAFYVSTLLAAKFFVSPAPKLLFTLIAVVLAWAINFGVKKRLLPYPGIVEHFVNWWFGGVDHYVPDVDEKPIPLVVTREMQVGEAVTKAATTVKIKKPRAVRRKRVQAQEAGRVQG
ncbi:hypothetical protein GCM10025871_35520 [Deinococcus metallilatus]|nr:hypothetical protein GCM10025871_35520 [Deinococcus metallilatus]